MEIQCRFCETEAIIIKDGNSYCEKHDAMSYNEVINDVAKAMFKN